MEDAKQYIVDELGRKRLANTEIVLPVCIGTVAWYLGKKGGEGSATHRWTVYCRGPNNEDLSYIIRRVTFDLHETFATPKRHIDHQPFEVTEMGWGEFDVGVTLHFTMDSRESEVTIFHRLKLYEEDGTLPSTKKPVVSETYDEVVFSEPYEDFHQRVSTHQPSASNQLMSQTQWVPQRVPEAEELARIQSGRLRVAHMMAMLARENEARAGGPPPAVDPVA